MKKTLDQLAEKANEYDKESQDFIASLRFVDKEINEINAMRRTDGWKILDKKIREELHGRIREMVKDDPKITTLIALLTVTDTSSMRTTLDEEIERLLPD